LTPLIFDEKRIFFRFSFDSSVTVEPQMGLVEIKPPASNLLNALDYELGMPPEELIDEIYKTVRANKMHSDVHIRMMITRGTKKVTLARPLYQYQWPYHCYYCRIQDAQQRSTRGHSSFHIACSAWQA
jgi:hypothetical protein